MLRSFVPTVWPEEPSFHDFFNSCVFEPPVSTHVGDSSCASRSLSRCVDPGWNPETFMIPVTVTVKIRNAGCHPHLITSPARLVGAAPAGPACGAAPAGLRAWQPVGCQPLELPRGEPPGPAGDGDTTSPGGRRSPARLSSSPHPQPVVVTPTATWGVTTPATCGVTTSASCGVTTTLGVIQGVSAHGASWFRGSEVCIFVVCLLGLVSALGGSVIQCSLRLRDGSGCRHRCDLVSHGLHSVGCTSSRALPVSGRPDHLVQASE